ncbi:hypothetical protein D3C87_1727880 [compost metagenome]|jgi:hypothetical protein
MFAVDFDFATATDRVAFVSLNLGIQITFNVETNLLGTCLVFDAQKVRADPLPLTELSKLDLCPISHGSIYSVHTA